MLPMTTTSKVNKYLLLFCIIIGWYTPKTMGQPSLIQQSLPSLSHKPTADELLNSYLKPVQFSKKGIEDFFKKRFNTNLYTERFLPSCFIHIIDWLEYGAQTDKPYIYYESVFDLFHQRLKGGTWVNPYALISFLERLPEFIEILPENRNQKLKTALREELENALLENFALLKKDPAKFLNQTATTLAEVSQQLESKEGSISTLQNAVTRFIEGTLNKLIWAPQDKLDIWRSFKLIAKKCEMLRYYGIIENPEDINRLIWSLLYRFGYFIDCAGSQMDYSFYRAIRQDLNNKKLPFLDIEEQEKWITTKRDYLNTILTEGELKSQAYEKGILPDGIH